MKISNKIFFRGLITGMLLLIITIPELVLHQLHLYFGIAGIILGGLQILSSFGCRHKAVWRIHMGCFLIELLYYAIGFLRLTFLLIRGSLSAGEYLIGLISAVIAFTWLLLAMKALNAETKYSR